MTRGYLFVLVAAVLWGCIGPVAKVALNAGMAPAELAFYRTVFGWVLFAAHAVFTGKARLRRADAPMVMAFGIFAVAGLFGSYAVAVREGGAALASVLLYTAPAWVAVLSRLLLKEPMRGFTLVAVGMTIVGVAGVSGLPQVLAGGGAQYGPLAVVFGLLSGLTYALYHIFGKFFQSRCETPTVFLYAMPVGAVTLLPFFEFSRPSLTALAACAILAVFCTYAAYSIYYAGLRYLETTRAAVTATLEPVVAAVLAYLWYDERFTLSGYLGGALILLAVLCTIWESMRQQRRSP